MRLGEELKVFGRVVDDWLSAGLYSTCALIPGRDLMRLTGGATACRLPGYKNSVGVSRAGVPLRDMKTGQASTPCVAALREPAAPGYERIHLSQKTSTTGRSHGVSGRQAMARGGIVLGEKRSAGRQAALRERQVEESVLWGRLIKEEQVSRRYARDEQSTLKITICNRFRRRV